MNTNEKPIKLEFGNPEHIKLAAEGYALGKAIESDLTGELETTCEDCDQCGGSGQVETFECSNCGWASDDEDDVIYTQWVIKHQQLDEKLLGRCQQCKAKLE